MYYFNDDPISTKICNFLVPFFGLGWVVRKPFNANPRLAKLAEVFILLVKVFLKSNFKLMAKKNVSQN